MVREYVYRTRHRPVVSLSLDRSGQSGLTESTEVARQWPEYRALLASRPPSRPAVTAFLACWPACLTSYLHCPPSSRTGVGWWRGATQPPSVMCQAAGLRRASRRPNPTTVEGGQRWWPEVVATTDIFILGPGQQPGQASCAGAQQLAVLSGLASWPSSGLPAVGDLDPRPCCTVL